MSENSKFSGSKVAIVSTILLGIIALVVSLVFYSSFFAIVGFSIVFWGILLFYVIPEKNNFYSFIGRVRDTGNIRFR